MDSTKRSSRFSPTERIGVNAVEAVFLNEFQWITRSQYESDQGIDSQVEVCVDGRPTGKLIAIQIKSGSSYFRETNDGCVVIRGKKVHYEYWVNHSLPVILVVYNPETKVILWKHLTKDSIFVSSKGWKTNIEYDHRLDSSSIVELSRIAEGPESIQRLRRLQFDRALMQRLKDGEGLYLEFEEWINKSLARTPLRLFDVDDDGNESDIRNTFLFYSGYSIEEMLRFTFPWADFSVDRDYYDEREDADSIDEAIGLALESDDYYMLDAAEDEECCDGDGYAQAGEGKNIYPYVECGEVARYRVKLRLNSLGQAFLMVDRFLDEK